MAARAHRCSGLHQALPAAAGEVAVAVEEAAAVAVEGVAAAAAVPAVAAC
jgi:hypothetical protein